MQNRFSKLPSLFYVLLLALSASGWAQDITKGSITGVVHDASGAVVSNAKVSLTSPFGDRATTTNSAGEFNFANLNPGPGYGLDVELAGFTPARVGNITVGVNRTTTQDIVLQVGAAVQTVEVSGGRHNHD